MDANVETTRDAAEAAIDEAAARAAADDDTGGTADAARAEAADAARPGPARDDSRPESFDTPSVARRRAREKRTISQMVALYCAGHHDRVMRTERAFCGEPVCPECKAIDDYAVMRTDRCRQMQVKTSCDRCPYHCYRPDERERICAIMRYAGPRMLTRHPIAAVRHLLGR